MSSIVVEDGSVVASANSYISVADADTYHGDRLHATDWTGATTANKTAALIWATAILDQLIAWNGTKTDDDSSLRWPRSDMFDRDGDFIDTDEIPVELGHATAELARNLIASDRTAEAGTDGFSEIKVASIMLKIDKKDRTNVIPDYVYQMISHLGRHTEKRSMVVKLERA